MPFSSFNDFVRLLYEMYPNLFTRFPSLANLTALLRTERFPKMRNFEFSKTGMILEKLGWLVTLPIVEYLDHFNYLLI